MKRVISLCVDLVTRGSQPHGKGCKEPVDPLVRSHEAAFIKSPVTIRALCVEVKLRVTSSRPGSLLMTLKPLRGGLTSVGPASDDSSGFMQPYRSIVTATTQRSVSRSGAVGLKVRDTTTLTFDL
ncbi:hypothetical protein EYF80_067285 [Liparis tanakae]|uniref:Uncharacterized protein n=1 Tax=Liparis tanakae TaxID=230148 RepID=A0A4Z2E1G1_9TELE|nr:hypothetical protein EYF80_067285 [Liparis tanakae]